MAFMYKNVGGMKAEKFLARLENVQWEVDSRAVEIAGRADDLLEDHHVENIAHIDMTKGRIDSYVNLVDSEVTNNETVKSNSALSIEFGRAGFLDDNGETWGQMEGLYILTRAAKLRKGRGLRSAKVRKNPAKFVPKGDD